MSIRLIQVTENISRHVYNEKLVERDLVSGQYKWLKISACKYIRQKKITSTKVTLPLNPKRIYIIDYMIVDGRLVNQWQMGNESRHVSSIQIADLQWCTTYWNISSFPETFYLMKFQRDNLEKEKYKLESSKCDNSCI